MSHARIRGLIARIGIRHANWQATLSAPLGVYQRVKTHASAIIIPLVLHGLPRREQQRTVCICFANLSIKINAHQSRSESKSVAKRVVAQTQIAKRFRACSFTKNRKKILQQEALRTFLSTHTERVQHFLNCYLIVARAEWSCTDCF